MLPRLLYPQSTRIIQLDESKHCTSQVTVAGLQQVVIAVSSIYSSSTAGIINQLLYPKFAAPLITFLILLTNAKDAWSFCLVAEGAPVLQSAWFAPINTTSMVTHVLYVRLSPRVALNAVGHQIALAVLGRIFLMELPALCAMLL